VQVLNVLDQLMTKRATIIKSFTYATLKSRSNQKPYTRHTNLICHDKHMDPTRCTVTPMNKFISSAATNRRRVISRWKLQSHQPINTWFDIIVQIVFVDFFWALEKGFKCSFACNNQRNLNLHIVILLEIRLDSCSFFRLKFSKMIRRSPKLFSRDLLRTLHFYTIRKPQAGHQIEGVLVYFMHLKCPKRIGDDVGT
jgi:hypothetical protein